MQDSAVRFCKCVLEPMEEYLQTMVREGRDDKIINDLFIIMGEGYRTLERILSADAIERAWIIEMCDTSNQPVSN